MRRAYHRRPNDFKRRILSLVYTTRQDMFDEEKKWQNLISDDELKGVRYYNIKRHGDRHWSTDPDKMLTVTEKLSKTMKEKHKDPDYRKIYEKGQLKRTHIHSPETREKRRISNLGKNTGKDNSKARQAGVDARLGKPLSEAHKNKIISAGAFKLLNSQRIKCKYCDFVGNPGNTARHHNENCKRAERKANSGK